MPWFTIDVLLTNLSNSSILNIKNADYCSIINGINKSEAIKLLQNIDFTEKIGAL